jgi:hypothetical protein
MVGDGMTMLAKWWSSSLNEVEGKSLEARVWVAARASVGCWKRLLRESGISLLSSRK